MRGYWDGGDGCGYPTGGNPKGGGFGGGEAAFSTGGDGGWDSGVQSNAFYLIEIDGNGGSTDLHEGNGPDRTE